MTPEEYMAYLMSVGMSEQEALQAAMSVYGGGYGTPDPILPNTGFDVGSADDVVDYNRNVNSYLADNVTAARAGGLGPYGGPVLGLNAFTPQVEREYVEAPSDAMLRSYAQRPEGTMGRWIADQLIGNNADGVPMTSLDIINMASSLATAWADEAERANLTPEQQAIGQMLNAPGGPYLRQRQSLEDPNQVETYFDFGPLQQMAQQLEEGALGADPNVMLDPTTGQYYTETETPTAQMEWFDSMGIPYPTMQYELGDLYPEAGALEDRAVALRAIADMNAPQGGADATAQAYRAWMDSREAKPPTPQITSTPPPERAPTRERPVEQVERFADAQEQGYRGTVGDFFLHGGMNASTGRPSGSDVPGVTIPTGFDITSLLRLPSGGASTGLPDAGPMPATDTMETRRARYQPGRKENRDMLWDRAQSAQRRQYSDGWADSLAAYLAEQEAAGKRMWDWSLNEGRGGYGPDPGIAQQRVDFATALARGRTPTTDALAYRFGQGMMPTPGWGY